MPLRQVILFGSYARDEQREESDIDVALIADEFTGAGFIDTAPFALLLGQYPYFYLEPHTFNTARFAENATPLVAEIKRTGIVVA